jgi:hypothetical protein
MRKKNIAFLTMILCAATISINAQSWSLTGNAGTSASTNFVGTTDSRPLLFKTNKVERMRITNSGLVGIGTTAPNIGYAVTVNPGLPGNGIIVNDPKAGVLFYGVKSGAGTGLYIQNTYTGNSTAIQGSTTGPGCGVYGSTGGGANSTGIWGYNYGAGFGVQANSENGAGVFASSTNNYGIYAATTNATYSAYFNRSIFVNGSVFTPSDQKLKQNIQDVASAMDIINQLHPKTYDYRQDDSYKLMKLSQGTHYGLIAQDIEKILPNLVKDTKFESSLEASATKPSPDGKSELQQNTKSETIDFKAVNYTELIPIMIKGMQEMQAKIDEQQRRIEELENRNALSNTSTLSSNSSAQATINTKATGAYLKQNAPNPFNQNTVINYYVPQNTGNAFINITDMNGRVIKTFEAKGNGQLMIESGQLTSGTYQYALVVNGKLVDTKKMVIMK